MRRAKGRRHMVAGVHKRYFFCARRRLQVEGRWSKPDSRRPGHQRDWFMQQRGSIEISTEWVGFDWFPSVRVVFGPRGSIERVGTCVAWGWPGLLPMYKEGVSGESRAADPSKLYCEYVCIYLCVGSQQRTRTTISDIRCTMSKVEIVT